MLSVAEEVGASSRQAIVNLCLVEIYSSPSTLMRMRHLPRLFLAETQAMSPTERERPPCKAPAKLLWLQLRESAGAADD